MTQLSNVHLLSDEVAHNLNTDNLKQQRMEQVSQTANKPENEKGNVIQMNPNQQQPPQQQPQQPMNPNQQPQQNQQVINENDFDEDDYSKYAKQPSNSLGDKKSKNGSDNKILGMKPVLFYGLLALGVGVAGYFAYKHFKGKGGKSLKAPSKAPVSGSDVTEATTEVAKAVIPST